MIDNQNETRLPHLKKNGEKAVLGSLCPPLNPVVPAGVAPPPPAPRRGDGRHRSTWRVNL